MPQCCTDALLLTEAEVALSDMLCVAHLLHNYTLGSGIPPKIRNDTGFLRSINHLNTE